MEKRPRSGMTFIEVVIVVAIVGILSSIAILTLANTRKHAVAMEAIVGLSSLKQAMRHFYAEHGKYQDLNAYLDPDPGNPGTYPEGINPGFLDGAYFRDGCYKIEAGAGSADKRVKCFPALSANPYGAGIADGDSDAERQSAYISLKIDGSFSQRNVSCSGYPAE
jgi:prepilin-type N-terminal cleavage/methylation domain-containing protein